MPLARTSCSFSVRVTLRDWPVSTFSSTLTPTASQYSLINSIAGTGVPSAYSIRICSSSPPGARRNPSRVRSVMPISSSRALAWSGS